MSVHTFIIHFIIHISKGNKRTYFSIVKLADLLCKKYLKYIFPVGIAYRLIE